MKIKGSMVPYISSSVKTRDEEFGLIIVSKRTPILTLNRDSSLIWKTIDGKRNVEDIAVFLCDKYCFNQAETKNTVSCFVESCCDLGLVEIN